MTNSPNSEDRKAAELLRSLENDQAQVAARRSEILSDVLAHYDNSSATREPIPVPEIVLVGEELIDRSRRPAVHRWLLVAAITLFALGLIALQDERGPSRLDVTGEADVEASPAVIEQNRAEVFSGTVSFDLPDGLTVSEPGPDLILISQSEAPIGVADAIVLINRNTERFADRVASLNEAGTLRASSSNVRVNDRTGDRWFINITQLGVDQLGCMINVPCLEIIDGLPSTAITSGLQVTVTEVITTEGDAVLVLANEEGPLRADIAAFLASLEFS